MGQSHSWPARRDGSWLQRSCRPVYPYNEVGIRVKSVVRPGHRHGRCCGFGPLLQRPQDRQDEPLQKGIHTVARHLPQRLALYAVQIVFPFDVEPCPVEGVPLAPKVVRHHIFHFSGHELVPLNFRHILDQGLHVLPRERPVAVEVLHQLAGCTSLG